MRAKGGAKGGMLEGVVWPGEWLSKSTCLGEGMFGGRGGAYKGPSLWDVHSPNHSVGSPPYWAYIRQ